jgi:hypothetical protein
MAAWTPGPDRRGLAQEDRAVAVGHLQAGIEGRRDLDEWAQQLEPLVGHEQPLAAEVLHSAEPVDVGGEAFEAGEEALHVGARPQVQHLFLDAERSRPPVDLRLAPRHRRRQEDEEQPQTPGH